MNGEYSNIKVAGLASAVPSYVMNSMDYLEIFGKRRVTKQVKMTGVERCHKSLRYQKTSDLCMRAVRELLTHMKWDLTEIKILVFCTQNPDYHIPSTAIDLADRLGLGKDCMAYDVCLGCQAFDLGVQTIAGLLQSQPNGTKAILLTGDVASVLASGSVLTKEDVVNQLMFGSGGAAVAIEKEPGNRLVFRNYSDGNKWDAILKYHDSPSMMDGNKVLDFALDDVAENMIRFQKEVLGDAVDYYCFSQAQKLILDNIVDTCGLTEEDTLISYDEYGDTSGAGIPITLCHNRDKLVRKGKVNICSCGFGVGLSMGITYFEIDPLNILPVIETDEHFDEHRKHVGLLHEHAILMIEPSNDLAEMLVRQLDRVGGNLSLYGEKEPLEKLKSQFFWKDCELFTDSFEKMAECTGKKFHSVVIDMMDNDPEKIKKQIQFLSDKRMLEKSCCIVLVTVREETDDGLREFINCLAEQSGCRVNAVVYVPESLDIYPDIGDSTEWLERQIRMTENQDMIRPFFLSAAVNRLLSKEFLAADRSIIHISDTVSQLKL